MKIMSIDIGIHHLGMTVARVNDDYTLDSVELAKIINLAEMKYHQDLPPIYYTNETSDRIVNLVYTFRENFENADKILIERQPPMGFKCIEQVLYTMFRDKVVLISPNSMHVFLGISKLDYDDRKEKTISIAEPYLAEHEGYALATRKHDIADSLCMILFYLHPLHEEYERARKSREMKEYVLSNKSTINFDNLKFKGKRRY